MTATATPTYLTVAIPYVNAAPHLGYAYELVLADIHARARRLDGAPTRFLGGTDDHSLKNVLAAEAAGVTTRRFVDDHAARFAGLVEPLQISFDDFIRTSADPRHLPAVHRLWHAAAEAGDLYLRRYTGDYCVGCERFYDADELDGGRCPEHRHPLEPVTEQNWFFRLSRYQDHVEQLIASDTLRITPEPFKAEALSFVRSGLEDISVSRSVERARGWGVPVPGDDSQVVYVWFDALANYISALGYGDPGSAEHDRWWRGAGERAHVIGKGILRFHAVYWPAFLASAGEPPPSHIRAHPYLTLCGRKLSKSAGAGVDPVAIVDTYGADALRWWFAREVAEVADTDFTEERLVARADEDLAGGIGNVAHRITTLVHRHRDGALPPPRPPLAELAGLASDVRADLRRFELRAATQRIVDAVAALNRDLERSAPWAVARDPARAGELDDVLARQHASACALADAVEPVTPALAGRLRAQLRGPRLAAPAPVAPRIEPPGRREAGTRGRPCTPCG